MDAEKVGKFIAAARKEKGLTQQELGDLLHVSDKAVSRWETGKGFPDISSMESLAEALEVSVAEIFKGERIEKEISLEDAEEITYGSLNLMQEKVKKVRVRSLWIGFLLSVVFLSVFLTHINAPRSIPYEEGLIKVEALDDGELVAVIEREVSGYQVDRTEDAGDIHISCYTTLWKSWTHQNQVKAILLGNRNNISGVYYYPGDSEDVLLFRNFKEDVGVETLPRLVYNMWLFIGLLFSAGGLIFYYVVRKKYYAETVLKIVWIPVVFTVSTVLILMGNMDKIYDAPYYLSGILLCAFALYALLLTYQKKKR